MVLSEITSAGKEALKRYAEEKDEHLEDETDFRDVESILDVDPLHYFGRSFQFMDDPEVENIVSKFEDEVDYESKTVLFRNYMIEEDYNAAAILSGKDKDMLEARFTREAARLRKKRSEYGLPMPNGETNTTDGAQDVLKIVNDTYDVVKGNKDDLYLDDIMPRADRLVQKYKN